MLWTYRKILKISPGAYIFGRGLFLEGAYIRRGLLQEGNLHFKIGWTYNWREICVKIFECATGNIRVLARNL